jgi:CDP-paratose 2-epimerase
VRDDLIAQTRNYEHHKINIRDARAIEELFETHRGKIDPIAHTASQRSHDWTARDPQTDFGVNATGTLNLLEAAANIVRKRRSSSPLPIRFAAIRKIACRCALEARREIEPAHEYEPGISETMSID